MYLEETCRGYLPLMTRYCDSYAARHYTTLSRVRSALCPFFLFLSEKGIANLRAVKPRTITDFLAWADSVWITSMRVTIISFSPLVTVITPRRLYFRFFYLENNNI